MTTKGHAQIRRGLLQHMSSLSPMEAKLYLTLHLVCDWSNGTYGGTVADLSAATGHCSTVVAKALLSLSEATDGRPQYVEYEPARNQWQPMHLRIVKYKRPSG